MSQSKTLNLLLSFLVRKPIKFGDWELDMGIKSTLSVISSAFPIPHSLILIAVFLARISSFLGSCAFDQTFAVG